MKNSGSNTLHNILRLALKSEFLGLENGQFIHIKHVNENTLIMDGIDDISGNDVTINLRALNLEVDTFYVTTACPVDFK